MCSTRAVNNWSSNGNAQFFSRLGMLSGVVQAYLKVTEMFLFNLQRANSIGVVALKAQEALHYCNTKSFLPFWKINLAIHAGTKKYYPVLIFNIRQAGVESIVQLLSKEVESQN